MFDYNTFWQYQWQLFPYLFLALSIISLWIKRNIFIWGCLLTLGIISGLFTQRLELLSLISIFALALGSYLSFNAPKKFFKAQFGILTALFAIPVSYHLMPGFNNLMVANQIKLTNDALPYSLYLNFDKPIIGLFILAFGLPFINTTSQSMSASRERFFKVVLLVIGALIVMPVLALGMNYVHFNPKWDNFFYLWIIDNLIFTCVCEEAYFRGFVQYGFMRFWSGHRYGNIFALLIASILFGLAHFRGGYIYVLLASIAGLFYGGVYLLTKRIEASIITHFLVNLTHILFFTYPALQK